MKITSKTTKRDLLEALRANYKLVKSEDANLAERVAYTGKNAKSATRKDLVDLVKEVMTLLGDKFNEPIVKTEAENSVKPVSKKSEDKKSTENTGKPKKSKKSEDKTSSVTPIDEVAVQLAGAFPETLKIDEDVYKIDHSVKTIADLTDGEFEFAFYWSERHLKQFSYFNGWLGQPKSFPNDIDTAQLIYVSDAGRVAYCVSDAMEAPYTILPEDLKEIDGIRFSSGIEFQIYRRVESTDTPDDTPDDTAEENTEE